MLLAITLALVFVSGMSTAVGFNCVIGLASQFPQEYVGAVMLGQGVAGVIVGLLRIVTKISFPSGSDPVGQSGIETSTMIYFLGATVIEVLCIISYFILISLPFAKFNMARATQRQPDRDDTGLLGGENSQDSSSAGPQRANIKVVLKKVALMGYCVWSVFFVTLSLFPVINSK